MKYGDRIKLDTSRVVLPANVMRFGRTRGVPLPKIFATYHDHKYMQVAAICPDCGFVTHHIALVEHGDAQKAAERCDEFRAYCGFRLQADATGIQNWICADCSAEQEAPL